MPEPGSPPVWWSSLLWLTGLTLLAFAVSWIAANRLGMRRAPYVAVLALVTGGLTAGHVAWLGVDVSTLLTSRWGWGLVAAPVSSAFLVVGMTRLPVLRRLRGPWLGVAMLWEAVVYGVAEGLLLSALPVLMTWQLVDALPWSGPTGTALRWTLPVAVSVLVIVVHHLGYWEYRNRLLVPISLGCGLLSAGYLVTASPVAPVLGHVLSHMSSLLRGAELPPHAHEAPAPDAQPVGERGTA